MLFRTFILRPLLQQRVRTATTVAGVALGIAVVIAIRLANAASVRGFETALETVAGKTSLEIVGAGAGIDETWLPSLGWLGEYGQVSPVIEGTAALVRAGGTAGAGETARRRPPTEAVRILGVDMLRDLPFREYRLLEAQSHFANEIQPAQPALPAQDFLRLLTNERSVVITEKLARRAGYRLGGEIRLMIGDRVGAYVVRGLLKDEGPARVLDGNFVLMDIAAAQLAFDRLGRLDRIDLLLPSPDDIHPALVALASRLPPGLRAQRPGRRGEQVETLLAAFHLNLGALSWIAMVVGVFLVYNTVTISVIARREEIGILRALGVSRRQVLGLFLAEAAALAAAGVASGLLLARVLADGALAITSATVSTIYIASAASPPALGWTHVVLAAVIGVPLSLVAAALPALEASRVPPTAAIRGHDALAMRAGLRRRHVLVPVVLLAGAAWLATLGPVAGGPYLGYLSSLGFVIGAATAVPAIMFGIGRASRAALRRRVEGLLAHANLAAAIPRVSISMAALTISLSMMVAIAVMIGSFRDTIVYWVGRTLQADLFVGPGIRPTVGSEQTLSPEVVAAVARHPDVVAVDSFRNVDLVYNGNLIVLGAGNFGVVLARGALLFKSPPDARAALAGAVGRDAVMVSESFATRYGVRDGAILPLATPGGPREFRVAAVYYDYSADRGVVAMDWTTFRRHYGDLPPTGIAAFLEEGADPDRVRTEILGSLDEGYRVFIYTNRDLRNEVLRVFDSTFSITYALELIAVVVAMLGVAGTLLTLVIERRRDLLLLRLAGADRRQVRRMVVIEAAAMGVVSQAVGLAVGFALSLVLIYVINVQSFGWTIQFHVPVAFLVQSSIAVVVATSLAGVYPARRAARLVLTQEE
jgi:putative ABC transport system permease protein